jgi:putative transposase
VTYIVPPLLELIKCFQKILFKLQCFLVTRYIANTPLENPVSEQYHKLIIDDAPVVEERKFLDNKKILNDYFIDKGKNLKPVKRRSNNPPSPKTTCPVCGATSEYIYDNTGGKGQLLCKVCNNRFQQGKDYLEKVVFRCPHCNCILSKIKSRKNFFVYKCTNNCCSFYRKNLDSMTSAEKINYAKNPHDFKLHFIYRVFDLDFDSLKKDNSRPSVVDISRIRNAKHVLGTVLTYHINYGLSTRQTSSIMRDIHQVRISHQTVANYAASVSEIIKPFVDNYPYDLSDDVAVTGDETYVRVKGKKHYVFFIMDTIKKIITSYSIFALRDGISAIKAIYSTLSKYKKIPENLTMIFDGNPIYLLAQHYFAQHGIHFNIKQVIGLTNDDPISKEYRPLKQMIERLNRTFKGVYRVKNGFNSFDKANRYMTLFAGFFNFLRVNKALDYDVPVKIPEIETLPDMPSKWLELIRLSYEQLEKLQVPA